MTFDTTLIQPCGEGWCVKTSAGLEGPLESVDDAATYAALVNRVNAARRVLVSQDRENI